MIDHRRPLLLVLLLTSVVLYHAASLVRHDFYHLPFDYLPRPVTVRWLGKTARLGRVAVETDRRRHRTTDWASFALAGLGGAFRFTLSQFREDIHVERWLTPWRLYLREEALLQAPPLPGEIDERFLVPLARFRAHLKGTAGLVVLPIPTKISIERTRFSEAPRGYLSSLGPAPAEDGRAGYAALARGNPDDTIDLQAVYEEHLALHPGDDLYIPYDSHWSSLGMAVAAKAVVEHLRRRDAGLPEVRLSPAGALPPAYAGDLLHALLLPKWFIRGKREFRWTEPLYNLMPSAASAPGAARLVVIGSSYSVVKHGTPYAFPRLVADAIGRELHNRSEPDVETVVLLDALNAEGFRLRKTDLVLLEFPYRRQWPRGLALPLPPID